MAYTQAQINAALATELAANPSLSQAALISAGKSLGLSDAQLNAAFDTIPGFNAQGQWDAADYIASSRTGKVDLQLQVDAARAAAQAELMRAPYQSVTDSSGREVTLTPYRPGFDINDPTTLQSFGELRARGGTDTTSQQLNAIATPAQKAEADRLWSIEKARLEEIDRQAALAAKSQPTGLLTGQPVQQGASEATKQAMDNLSAKKSYTDTEVKQALKDLSYLDPKASIKDIITAAQTYGIDKDRVVKNISSFTYTAENVDKLSKQILAQNTTATWKGDVKPETAARYMADDLAKSGITDISQVGKGTTGIINKETGEKLVSGYGERTKGNLWSGSYEGKGNTGFGVQFTDSGKPIFYTEGASSSTLKKDLLKAAVVAAAAFGIFGPESLSSIYGSGAAVGEGLTAAEAFAAGLTPAQAAAAGLTAAELTAAGYTAAEVATAATAATTATTTTGLLTGNAATTAATTLTASELATAARLGLTATQFANLLTSGGQTVAGLLQQETSREAAVKAQGMIDTETAAAKQAAAFRPVGMTTRFGTSEFKLDPKTGQLTSAGYTASPGVLEAQNRLVALGNQGLAQAEAAQGQFAPLQTGAQRLFELGQGYLAKTPQDVAQNYLNQQMALLQPGRETELANLQNRLQQQGRGGLAVAQGGNLGDTTPELQALFNARAQQEAQLAANAQQYGQQQVGFGAGLLSQGAQTMGQYYGGQQAAYAPYTTALGQFTNLEQLAQQPLQMGASLAQQSAQAGANVGRLGLLGAGASVDLATGKAATTNPYATALGGITSNPLFGEAVGSFFGTTKTPEQEAIDRYMKTFG